MRYVITFILLVHGRRMRVQCYKGFELILKIQRPSLDSYSWRKDIPTPRWRLNPSSPNIRLQKAFCLNILLVNAWCVIRSWIEPTNNYLTWKIWLLGCFPLGSFIYDGCLIPASSTIGEKSRTRMVFKFKGRFLQLAVSKFGSRVFDGLWAACKGKEKLQMMAEMDRTLLSTPSGRVVAKKIQLELYLNDKKSWLSKQSNTR